MSDASQPRPDPGEGTLEQANGRWRLRFVRVLAQPPARVWRALTEEQDLAAWFPTTIDGDLRPGGELSFGHRGHELPAVPGRAIAIDPPRALEFDWGFSGDPAVRRDRMRLELLPEDDGTRLVLVTTYDQLGKSARDGAGWHACLDALERHLAGMPSDPDPVGTWKVLSRKYRERFGPEAATIGPPESMSEYRED